MTTLLHIGVPKTGTTAVQAALVDHARRAPDGFTLPGTPAEQARAALAVLGRRPGWRRGEPVTARHHWDRLVRRVHAATGPVVVSSEFLCEADPACIRRICADLDRGDGDLRVVVTLRPLAAVLPSAWQQYLKSGHDLEYGRWLRAVLADPPQRSVTPSFWRRHDHGAVVERWAEQVGARRLTVVVVDDDDRDHLLRSFDRLLGLPAGALRPGAADRGNRSMSAAEAELFRRVNVALRRADVPWSDYSHLVRYGAILRMVEHQSPPPGAPRVVTPAWALERAAGLGRGHADRIAGLRGRGLEVLGDLDRLGRAPGGGDSATGTAGTAPGTIPIEAAVEALLGAVARAGTGATYFTGEDGGGLVDGLPGTEAVDTDRLPAAKLTTGQVGDLLYRRVRGGLRRRRRVLASRIIGTQRRPD